MDDLSKQFDEIEAMTSIYGEEWNVEDADSRNFSFNMIENDRDFSIYVHLPTNYPSEAPPTYDIMAPSLTKSEKDIIDNELNKVYLENLSEPILYQWIEKIRECLQFFPPLTEKKKKNYNIFEFTSDDVEKEIRDCPEIHHGEIIEDRKSYFQAHVARVKNNTEIKAVLRALKSEKKIAEATHNITAWICNSDQDYDDDGEKAAGGRLLRLLSLSNAQNVIVVVSRWYGGKHLGPDRFRHINNAAKQALIQAGVLEH